MPSLDKASRKSHREPKVAYRASESHVFSSSGSEGESVTTPPARSRGPSYGSVVTNSSRTRASRSGTGHTVPPQRGTASVRNSGAGGIASSRGSQAPPHRPSTGNGESGVRSTGGSGHPGSGSGSIKGTSSSGRRSGSQKSSRRQSAPSSLRDKQQRDLDVTTSTAATAAAAGSNDSKGLGNKTSSTTKSMPNLSGLLVAPLSRPIPTDAVGYLYGDDYDWRHGDDSRSLTPQPSPSPPRQPPKPPRSERSRRRSLESGGSGNGHGHGHGYGVARESGSRSRSHHRSDRDVASASSGWGAGTPPPPVSPSASLRSTSSSQLMRSRSTPDREVVKVVEHHRRNSSGPIGVVNPSSSSKPRSERRSSTQGITSTGTVRREDGSRSSAPLTVSSKKSKRSREGSSSRSGSSRSKSEREWRRTDASYDEDLSQGGRRSSKEKVAGEDSAGKGARESTFDVAIEFNGNDDGRECGGDVVREHSEVEAEPAIVPPDAPPSGAVIRGENLGIASGTVAAIAAQVEANSTPESSPPRALVLGEEVGIATGTVAALAARTNKKVRDGNANTYVTEREKDLERSEIRARVALQRGSAVPVGSTVAAEAAAETAVAVRAQRDAEIKAAQAAAAQVARQQAEAKAQEAARVLARVKAAAAAEALSVGDAGPSATGETKTADVLAADEDTPWAARVEPEASISDVEDGDEDWVAISRAAEAAEKEKMAAAAAAERAVLEARALEHQRHLQQQQKEEEEARATAEEEEAAKTLGEVNAQEEATQGGEEREVEDAPPAEGGGVLGGRSPGHSESDRDRGESSASAEMLSAPEEEAEVEGVEGEGDEVERVSDEVLLAQHREAVLIEQEQGQGRRELAMHRVSNGECSFTE